jgi:hypothetical protein
MLRRYGFADGRAGRQPRDPPGRCRLAAASRAVIDQAIGVLMGQRRIAAAEAFAILRTTSQNRNIKLRAFAAQIVEGAGALPPLPPPFDPPR